MEMASPYTKFMSDAKKKANELLLDQQREFLSTLEVKMEEEFENHEDTTLRSEGKIEAPKEVEEVEEVVKNLDGLEEIEEESASSEPEEKNIETEAIPKMIP